jgi:hypothetical protein
MNLHNLPFFTLHQIYDNLDNDNRKNLANTSKNTNQFFKDLKKTDDFLKKIVIFILENYQIAESSHESVDLKKIFFINKRLILLTEMHCQEEHRYLNGLFVQLIWNGNSVLQVEGGDRSLEHARQNQTSVFRYIPKEISQTAGTWDLPDDNDAWKLSHELFFYAKSAVSCVKDLLSLFDNKSFSFNTLSKYLETYYSDVDVIYREIPEIALLKENESHLTDIEINKLKNKIYCIIANITLITIDENFNILHTQEAAVTKLRNEHLTCKVKDVVFTSGKSATFFTGSNHARDPYVISYVKNLNKMFHIPYLFLIPKPFITPDSIQKSYNKLFMNAKAETKQPEMNETCTVQVKEPINEEEHFNNLKNLLLSFDVDKIDMDLNHFGKWLYISNEILKRLSLPIAPKI